MGPVLFIAKQRVCFHVHGSLVVGLFNGHGLYAFRLAVSWSNTSCEVQSSMYNPLYEGPSTRR